MTYIALLRAINVGGNVARMAVLREAFEKMGFEDVRTYINTGNVLFASDKKPSPAGVEDQLKALIDLKTEVFLLTPNELKKAAKDNPIRPANDDHCHLVFLSKKPAKQNVENLMKFEKPEYRFAVKDKIFYFSYSREFEGNRRRSLNFEKLLDVRGTARTYKVVDKLIELAEK